MTLELKLLAWTLVLAVVQVMFASYLRTRETGTAYNIGPRDDGGPPIGVLTGRMQRAQRNLFETLPIFAAAVLIADAGGREGDLTLYGTILYLAGRIVYVPLYAFGVTGARTLVWGVSFVGLILVLAAII